LHDSREDPEIEGHRRGGDGEARRTVAEAARVLSEKRIGSVVVSPDGRAALGILSERDIVREIGGAGRDA
jgi:CBS domain-containing protein